MSTTIDQRVVEMRFDNKQFESATAQSMSTIDRLKQKLNFKDAGKGLEGVSAAAKKVDMNSLAKGVESVQVKFSSLQVIATTALANITNAAINAGKNLVSSFTIDPIVSGFREYETQMNAVQTILTNTRTKGTTLDQVNEALAELNTYADQTIYNFTQMTENIGRFTAAGVDLDTSVNSIKGLANLAAASGSSANQAAMAMYQLSQALASGTIRLQDWISVENAGMGGELFQNALKRTAEHFGTDVDAMIAKYGTFRASLTEGGWLTVDVMTETLKQLSGVYTEAELISQGYTEEQAKEIVELANSAMDAATKVKTFTQLIGTMKEAVGSGWAQTWQLIIGDFEEAKELWTGISDFFTGENGIITKMSTARNTILEGALYGNPFSDLAKKIDSVTTSTDKMTESTKDYSSVVDKVIKGDFGNGAERVDELTKANYDYAHVQNLVNEKLGSSVRYATDYKEAQDGVSKSTKTTAEDLVKLSDAQLVMMGFTQQEVEALRDLEEQSQRTGIPLNSLIENVDQLNGRTLLINSFKNAAKGLVQVFTSISDGWRKAFWGDAREDDILAQKTERLYNLIAALHKFSQNLVMSDETVDKLTRTFEGLFAILDLVSTVLGGGFKLAFEVVSKLLGAFDMDILDLTARLGDAAVALRDFILDNEFVNKGFELLADGIVAAAKAIKGWIDTFLEIPAVQAAIEKVKNTLSNLKDVGLDAIEGLKNGLQNGITSIPEILVEIGRRLLDAIKGVLGIHSPSTEMHEVGENIIEGLINGIKSFLGNLWEVVSGIGSKLIELFGQIDWGNVFAVLLSVGGMVALYKFASAISALTAPLEGLGDILEGVGNVLDAFSGTIKAFNFKVKAEAIKTFAIAIAILAGSVLVLSFVPAAQLWNAVGVIAALAAVITGLSIAVGKFGTGGIVDTAKIGGLLLALSTSFLLLSGTMKILSGMSWAELEKASAGLMALGMVITGLVAATKIGGNAVGKAGGTILKISIAMGALVLVGKMIAGMEWSEMGKAAAGLGGLTLIVGALIAVTKLAGNNIDKVGGTILKISIAMGALVLVSKLISGMEWDEMGKAAIGLGGLTAIVAVLIGITKLAGNNVDKIGGTILKISIAMGALVLVAKLISGMEWDDMGKAAVGLLGLSAIVAVLIGVTKLGSEKDFAKLGTMLLMVSASIGILAGISVLLSLVSTENLIKGITAVGALSALMSMMIVATGFAKRSKGLMGNLIVITVAITLLAGAAAALSFIETGKLLGATTALVALMTSFGLMAKLSSSAKGALGTITVLTLVVAALGGILYLLSGLPVESSLAVAASLSMLLLALSTSMMILSKTGTVSPMALVSLGVLTLIAGGLGALLALITQMNPGPTLEIATSISVLLLSLSAVCLILSAVGATGPAALIGVGIFSAVVVAIGGLMVAIGALTQYFPQLESFLDTGIGLLEKIGYGLGSAIGSIVGGFAAGVTSGLPEIGSSLSTFMENAQGFIDGASGVDASAFDGIGALAGAIITLTAANVIEAIGSWLTGGSSMEEFAESLVPFGEAMVEFSNTLTGMDTNLVSNAAIAGKTLAEMAATIPNSGGIVSWFTGENDMEAFGDRLVPFGEAMVEYSKAVAGMDTNAVMNSATAGKALTELANTIPNSGGLIGDIMGENDMGMFGAQLVQFGRAMQKYSEAVAGLDTNAVTNSAIAGKALTELASTVPNTGGLVSWFTGDNDLATFGTQLVAFGTSIKDYSAAVVGIDEGAVTASAIAGKALTELASTVPNTGGLVSWFTGDNDLYAFGNHLVVFGHAMKNYSEAVVDIDVDAVSASVTAAAELVSLSSKLDNSGGLVSWFTGDNDLATFGDNLVSFGNSISNYANSVSGINTSALSAVISQIYRLISMAQSMSGLDTSGMSSFGKALTNLAKADIEGVITTYTNAYGRVESAVQGLVTAMSTSVSNSSSQFVSSVAKMITEALAEITGQNPKFTTAGQDLVENLVNGIRNKQNDPIKAFEDILKATLTLISQNGPNFNKAGQDLVGELASGIKSQSKTASSSFDSVLSSMIISIRNQYTGFYNAGMYLVQGFANGINQNTYLATAQARAMATAAETAAKNALGIHSPSTAFYMVGENVIKGFVQGVKENVGKVEDTGEDVAESVVGGAEDALDVKNGYSELAKEVIGESFVNGIAEGITENMSAEEAAAKKAENIVEAFENAMEKIDFSSETLDLEQQLWDTVNENLATDATKDSAMLQTLLKQYEYQNQRLELAKAEYQTMIEQFGEQSQQAKESYNRMLQQQIDLADLSNQIIDIKDAEVERELDILDQQDELLQHEYQIWKNKNSSALTEAKEAIVDLALLSERYAIQLQKVNAAQSKYQAIMAMFGSNANETYEAYNEYLSQYEELSDISKQMTESRNTLREENWEYSDIGAEVDKMKDWIHRSTEAFSSSIGSSYQQSIHEALDGLTPAFSEQGTTYAEALAEGLKTGIEQLSAVSNDAIGQATDSAVKQENTFASIGEQIGSGLIFGIQNGMSNLSWLESEETYSVLVSFVEGLNTLLGDTYGETFIGVGSFIFSFIDEGITVSFQTFIKTKIPEFMSSIDRALRSYGYLAYQAGVYVGTEFMNGLSSMAAPIQNKAREIGHSAGSALSAGLSSAIRAGKEQIDQAAKDLISYAQNATMGALDAHSPSRVFMEIGSYIPLGLAKGIKDNANVVSDPISSMAVTAIENTKNTISKIAEAVNGDMNIQPTIRPVLDLSNVENGTKKLNAMFSRNRALSIDRDMSARSTISSSVPDSTDSTVSDAGTTFNFTQNNYSPKALSRVEIYRQTNNQFSAFKRAVRV